jgi:hypothetical protein
MRPMRTLSVTSLAVLLVLQVLVAIVSAQNTPSPHQGEQAKKAHTNVGSADAAKPPFTDSQIPKSPTPTSRLTNARIDAIDPNFASVTITDCPSQREGHSVCNGAVMTLSVGEALRPELKALKKSDHVTIDTDGKTVSSIGIRQISIPPYLPSLVLGITAALFFILTTLLTRGHPLKLIIGQDGRYSNSKFQMAIWFWIVLSTYLAFVYLRVSQAGWEFFDSIDIPKNLLLLSGMSALTFGGAKGITTAKANAAIAAGNPNPKDPVGVHENFWTDLVQNDAGAFDIGDFQMLMVTLLAVGMYVALTLNFLETIAATASASLRDVDTTILASFGLGQGAYLTKKAVGNAGTS